MLTRTNGQYGELNPSRSCEARAGASERSPVLLACEKAGRAGDGLVVVSDVVVVVGLVYQAVGTVVPGPL